jgi:hypothetical protein
MESIFEWLVLIGLGSIIVILGSLGSYLCNRVDAITSSAELLQFNNHRDLDLIREMLIYIENMVLEEWLRNLKSWGWRGISPNLIPSKGIFSGRYFFYPVK